MKRLIHYMLIIVLFWALMSPAYGYEGVTVEKVNPTDTFTQYFKKRLNEKISMIFTFSSQKKADKYEALVVRRFNELVHILETDAQAHIETGTQRYFTTVGKYTEYINEKNLEDEKKEAIELIQSHKPVISDLQTNYDGTTAQWRFIQYDLDYIDTYAASLQ